MCRCRCTERQPGTWHSRQWIDSIHCRATHRVLCRIALYRLHRVHRGATRVAICGPRGERRHPSVHETNLALANGSFQWHSFGGPGCRTRGSGHRPSGRTAQGVDIACPSPAPPSALEEARQPPDGRAAGPVTSHIADSTMQGWQTGQHAGVARRDPHQGTEGECGRLFSSTRHQAHSPAHRQRARYGPRERRRALGREEAIVSCLRMDVNGGSPFQTRLFPIADRLRGINLSCIDPGPVPIPRVARRPHTPAALQARRSWRPF